MIAESSIEGTRREQVVDKANYIIAAARHGTDVSMMFETEQRRKEMRIAIDHILNGERLKGAIRLSVGLPTPIRRAYTRKDRK